MKLPKKFVIVEIIPSHSNANCGFIVQLQALRIEDNKIIKRMDYRINKEIILNEDLKKIVNYDNEMFTYVSDKETILEEFKKFIHKDLLLIIDNYYTIDYLKEIKNKKESVFKYLNMDYSDNIFDLIMDKYQLEPSNHLVDILFEALMFENRDNE